MFASAEQLAHLARSRLWFLDGTFRVVNEPFVQLLTIHSFLKSGDVMKQVPLCFALMSRKKKHDYVAVINAIIACMPHTPVVEEIIVDFEKAVWGALRMCLPVVSVRGCWFHWAQAVYRRIKKYGLRNAYMHQIYIRAYVRELMALPNLPASHIEPAFLEMKVRCPNDDRLHALLEYMQKTWILSPSRPPAAWSTFKRSVRTNNDAEGWHHRLNFNVPHNHLNMYVLIKSLHHEASILPLQMRLVAQHKLYRYQCRRTQSKQAALKQLWLMYECADRTISTSQYLRQCANLADHVEE